jgi:hypothetical protein
MMQKLLFFYRNKKHKIIWNSIFDLFRIKKLLNQKIRSRCFLGWEFYYRLKSSRNICKTSMLNVSSFTFCLILFKIVPDWWFTTALTFWHIFSDKFWNASHQHSTHVLRPLRLRFIRKSRIFLITFSHLSLSNLTKNQPYYYLRSSHFFMKMLRCLDYDNQYYQITVLGIN